MSSNLKYSLLPVHVIKQATQGDSFAVKIVLAKYQGYILRLSSQNYYELNNNELVHTDEYMKRQLETKLIEKILKFDITR